MAMLPFCGYNMADYFGHWLEHRPSCEGAKLPRIFHVNWFRKDDDGKLPVAGLRREQPRARVGVPPLRRHRRGRRDPDRPRAGRGRAQHRRPRRVRRRPRRALKVDPAEWKAQLEQVKAHFDTFGDRLPSALREQLAALEQRLNAAS